MSRSLLVDMGEDIPLKLKKAGQKDFHNMNCVGSLKEGGYYYARSMFTKGREVVDKIREGIRSQLERCDYLQGMVYMGGLGGGTTSGIISQMPESLGCEFGLNKKCIWTMALAPEFGYNNSGGVLEPYNSVFALENIM